MRRVIRLPLAEDVEENLNQRQAEADRKRMEGALRVNENGKPHGKAGRCWRSWQRSNK